MNSNVHRAAVDLEKLAAGGNTASTSSTASGNEQNTSQQPRIDDTMHRLARAAYEKLMKSAYMLAVDGLPLSSFKTVVRVQKANGVRLITGNDNGHAAREFVHEIALAIKEKLALILCSVRAFSLLCDGSQARKTGKEKELVLIRVVRGEGIPLYYCVSLADLQDYGDATAENLKACLDDIFLKKLGVPKERYTKRMVSMTADGASVNFGQYRGLLTRMSNDDRDWLLKIHCVCHRLELAIKDSLLKNKQLSAVKDFMLTLYYLFKQSGKVKAHFEQYGSTVLGATIYIFPKVSGTRFVSHVRRGLHHLLHNWPILYRVCEDCISSTDANMRGIKPKMQGVMKKLKDGKFFLCCVVLRQLLDVLSQFSLQLERGEINVFDVDLLVDKTEEKLQDILTTDIYEYLQNEWGITVTDQELKWKIAKTHHNKRAQGSREYVVICIPNPNITSWVANAESLLEKAVPDVIRCMDERFASFKDEVFLKMSWLDPANWHDTGAEVEALRALATRFATTLAFSGFDGGKLKEEWSDLKRIVDRHYKGVQAPKLWQNIFQYRKHVLPNVCMLAEIVLCIGVSNSIVEKGFSQLTAMMSDRRLGTAADTMENLMLIKVNNLTWTPEEREEIIKRQ